MLRPALLLLLLASALPAVLAQVPRVCVQNATQVNATCCPSSGSPAAPCGGPKRGSCSALKVLLNGTEQAPTGPLAAAADSRQNWPIYVFQYMCKCSFFYSGLACETSKLDFGKGKGNPFKNYFKPTAANKRVRRDVANLTTAERTHVRDVLLQSKQQMSDWVIINDTATDKNADGSKKVSYFNVSVYDFYVFLNYYATKGLNFDARNRSPAGLLDLAHKSPSFPAWHRLFLSEFERALDSISRNITLTKNPAATAVPLFALPYWNWTDQTHCAPCTADLLGEMDATDSLSSSSPFASWRVLCGNEDPAAHPCDPGAPRPLLRRTYGDDPRHEALPTAAEVAAVMNASQLDAPPCNERANASSFRNLLEGFIGADNNLTAAEEGQRYMGMKVRKFINGTFSDLALGPNDPLFWMHQAFLDKIFDEWSAAAAKGATDLPAECPSLPGQNRSENMAPFLPPAANWRVMFGSWMFADGYSYDVAATGIAKQGAQLASWSFSSVALMGAILVAAVVVAVVAVVMQRRRRKYREVQTLTFDPVTERQPLLAKSA